MAAMLDMCKNQLLKLKCTHHKQWNVIDGICHVT